MGTPVEGVDSGGINGPELIELEGDAQMTGDASICCGGRHPGQTHTHRSCHLRGSAAPTPGQLPMPLLAAVAAISDALAAPGGTASSTLLAAPDDLADRKVAQTCKCTISAEKLGRPPTLDHAIGGTRKPTRYLFIMGYPFTGTTAFHALLAQGTNVSALDGLRGQRQALLSPEKEGWAKLGWKHREDVWSASDSALNWTALSETYHRNWNLKKPLLVENSPPEMSRADALNRTFSPRGKVRFIVLAHSMCAHDGDVSNECPPGEGNRTSWRHCWAKRAATAVDIARRYGPEAIVVRYEDLCLQWGKTMAALESWEPLLGGVSHLADVPVQQRLWQAKDGDTEHHSHRRLSFQKYCSAINQPKWKSGLRLRRPVVPKGSEQMKGAHKDSAAYLGYRKVDDCVW